MLRNLRSHSPANWFTNRKTFTAGLVSSLCMTGTILLFPSQAEADEVTSSTSPDSVVIDGIKIAVNDPAWDEYNWQLANGAPGVVYWNRVAKCETRRDWKDHGTWAGGLGIFTAKRFSQPGSGTWERWGGEQFGLRPQDATPLQQMVVANRIAMFGWKVTYRDWNGYYERVVQKVQYKKPAGFNGWGCIKTHRNGKKKGQWHINLNPRRFENARKRYWSTGQPPYMTHQLVLHKMNIPKWAYNKYPNDPNRFK